MLIILMQQRVPNKGEHAEVILKTSLGVYSFIDFDTHNDIFVRKEIKDKGKLILSCA